MPGDPAGTPAKPSQLHILKINLIKMSKKDLKNWFKENKMPYNDYFVGLSEKEKGQARALIYHVSRCGVDMGLLEFFMHNSVDVLGSDWMRELQQDLRFDVVKH